MPGFTCELKSDEEMAVFSTIAGNDVTYYDELYIVHKSKFGSSKPEFKFPAIAKYIKEPIDTINFKSMHYQLAQLLFCDQSKTTIQRINNSISFYDTVS